MLTVVGKLLHLTGARSAYFGQKDAQQLLLIRRMVRDLDFPVDVVSVPTVREPDGLAMSSRNTYLTESDRDVALALSRALRAGAGAAPFGPSAIRRAAREVLVDEPLALVDYLVLVHPSTLEDVPEWYRGEALLAVAARVGTTRLIDNQPLLVGPGGGALEVFSAASPPPLPERTVCRRGIDPRPRRDTHHRVRRRALRAGRAAAPALAHRAGAGLDVPAADVIVVGSGIAGLTCALRLRERVDKVLLVTKTVLDEGSTAWAQGGIAAALDPEDSADEHLHDTLVAGVGLCDVTAVRALVTEGPDRVRELVALGAEFDRDAGGRDQADPRGRPPPRPDRPRRR